MPANDPTWNFQDPASNEPEGYLPAFAGARANASAEEPLGLQGMAELVDKGAKALRKVPRVNGGTARGDEQLAGRFRDLFFPI